MSSTNCEKSGPHARSENGAEDAKPSVGGSRHLCFAAVLAVPVLAVAAARIPGRTPRASPISRRCSPRSRASALTPARTRIGGTIDELTIHEGRPDRGRAAACRGRRSQAAAPVGRARRPDRIAARPAEVRRNRSGPRGEAEDDGRGAPVPRRRGADRARCRQGECRGQDRRARRRRRAARRKATCWRRPTAAS